MNRQKKKLIVFDIDGTLTDTVEIHQQAFRQSLGLIGVATFNDAFGSYKHHTDVHIAKVIFELATGRDFDTVILESFENHLYDLIVLHDIKAIRGARQMIEAIEKDTDFGICYATGSLYKPAKLKLERLGIDFAPIQLVASNELEEREQIVAKAIEQAKEYYGVDQFERTISVGDGLWDLKTARNLSLEFIGIGAVNEQILKANGMEKHFLDFHKLEPAAF